jgi:CelD/BcsL family acetyltransferase involved in cellulose biosynthesis
VPATSLLSVHASPPIPIDGGCIAQLRPFPCETSPAFEAAWRDLERRSLLRNPFLSPSFLLSQYQSEEGGASAQLLTIIDGQGNWLLAGLFERVSGTRQLPLPHMRAVRTAHSFKTGMLVDATQRELVVETLWKFLRQQNLHGLSFPMFPMQSALASLLTERCQRDRTAVIVRDLHARATVSPFDGSAMSPKRAKSLRRGRRALEKFGNVSLRFTGCPDGELSAVERFLYLESLGWKGEAQSALACCPSEVEALKSLALRLATRDRIRFAELALDERVIASLCLFRSESDYYAFKIGWDPQFERGCPGFLLAAEIQDNLSRLPRCASIDSCASPGSFLDHVWPGRKQIGTVLFTTTLWGSAAAKGMRWARDVYRQMRGHMASSGVPNDVTTRESGDRAEEPA